MNKQEYARWLEDIAVDKMNERLSRMTDEEMDKPRMESVFNPCVFSYAMRLGDRDPYDRDDILTVTTLGEPIPMIGVFEIDGLVNGMAAREMILEKMKDKLTQAMYGFEPDGQNHVLGITCVIENMNTSLGKDDFVRMFDSIRKDFDKARVIEEVMDSVEVNDGYMFLTVLSDQVIEHMGWTDARSYVNLHQFDRYGDPPTVSHDYQEVTNNPLYSSEKLEKFTNGALKSLRN